jgi:CelD/BcsL family acetyltransferase involved in cellulose biosynthesis
MNGAERGTGAGRAEWAGGRYRRRRLCSFEEADKTQRNKSRRKHDRQQGEKLEAMGAVAFEVVGNGAEAEAALDTMFRQRALRFREMGVSDPFTAPAIRKFYDGTVAEPSGVSVKLHVLRLDGEIVAMRYNIVHGERLFCLISSMSEDAALRPGHPASNACCASCRPCSPKAIAASTWARA